MSKKGKNVRISKSEFERIRADFLKEREVLMQNLFESVEESCVPGVPCEELTRAEENKDTNQEIAKEIHQYCEEFTRRKADEHRQARQEFQVIIPTKRPSYEEIRARLSIIPGGCKRGREKSAMINRRAFRLRVNHRSDLAIEVVNDMVELGLL